MRKVSTVLEGKAPYAEYRNQLKRRAMAMLNSNHAVIKVVGGEKKLTGFSVSNENEYFGFTDTLVFYRKGMEPYISVSYNPYSNKTCVTTGGN